MRTAIVDGAVADLFALQDRLAAELLAGLPRAGEGPPAAVATAAAGARTPAAAPEGLGSGIAAGGEAAASGPGGRPGAPPFAGAGRPPFAGAGRPPFASGERPPPPPGPPPGRSPRDAGIRPGAGLAAAPGAAIDGPPPPVAPATITRDGAGRATVRAVRLDEPLRIDGVLDEGVYEIVTPVSDFLQQLPVEGAPASEKTEAWIFFDAENVYVSARIWDSAPESDWIANEMQRDSFQLIQNDTFSLSFDTFYDRRNGAAFMINPLGGFFDYQITDEGNPNNDWNPIWDSRTGRFDGGWTVETRVPFKSLRFQPGQSQLWGLQLARTIRRKNEWTYLTRVPISGGPGMFRVSAGATLTGLEVPRGNRVLEVKPYAIGGLATDVNAVPDPIVNDGTGDVGLDVKFGVTENLTADFTYNTDFAQVEVDEQQVNLTRFSLFFPEKREFFLESRGIFDFGRGAFFGGGRGRGRRHPARGRLLRRGRRADHLLQPADRPGAEGRNQPHGADPRRRPPDRQGRPVQHRRHRHPYREPGGRRRAADHVLRAPASAATFCAAAASAPSTRTAPSPGTARGATPSTASTASSPSSRT